MLRRLIKRGGLLRTVIRDERRRILVDMPTSADICRFFFFLNLISVQFLQLFKQPAMLFKLQVQADIFISKPFNDTDNTPPPKKKMI